MSGFNFLFEAFILLMGLAMAEVLRGFARVLKLRSRRKAGIDPGAAAIRIGWLVPLLGLFVIVDQSTFFIHMYAYRTTMPFNGGTVLGILLTIGWYYLIASLTFPDEPADWPDFDAWFWLQKRFVVGGVIGVNVLSPLAMVVFDTSAHQAATVAAMEQYPRLGLANLLVFLVIPAMIWLFFTKSSRVAITLLAFINLMTLIYGALVFAIPQPG